MTKPTQPPFRLPDGRRSAVASVAFLARDDDHAREALANHDRLWAAQRILELPLDEFKSLLPGLRRLLR